MNSEQMKTLAAEAITEWARHHNGSCVLSVEGGLVVCKEPTDHDRRYGRTLIITRFAQNAGLTSAAWNIVGTELFNQYTKELACQAHQKH